MTHATNFNYQHTAACQKPKKERFFVTFDNQLSLQPGWIKVKRSKLAFLQGAGTCHYPRIQDLMENLNIGHNHCAGLLPLFLVLPTSATSTSAASTCMPLCQALQPQGETQQNCRYSSQVKVALDPHVKAQKIFWQESSLASACWRCLLRSWQLWLSPAP